jgi:hypothetical protein
MHLDNLLCKANGNISQLNSSSIGKISINNGKKEITLQSCSGSIQWKKDW